MEVVVQCPVCNSTLRTGADLVGRRGRCQSCGHTFVISGPGAEVPSPDAMSSGGQRRPSGSGNGQGSAPSGSPLDPTIPATLGRFEIRARLGAGAFGTVYRAFDPLLDREVALKVPQPGALQTPRAVERFLREAKSAAQLHHPHIVPVFDAGTDGAHHYIASAFIAGQTLAEAIDAGPLDPRTAARIALDLGEGLDYAHAQGVVHRDVKPANVMLDPHGQAYLMDFGLARLALTREKLTHAGAPLGTPAYMAPEQAAGRDEEVGPASDQYSLGVLLYELLCGETPFAGPPEVVLFNAIRQPPPPPRTIKPDVPLDLETICLKALAKGPRERYGSCREMADDLRRWLDGEPILARRMGPVERLVRWSRRHPWAAVQAGSVLGALMLGTVVSSFFAVQAEARRKEVERFAKAAERKRTEAEHYAAQAVLRKQEADRRKAEAEQLAKAEAKKADELERQLYVTLVGRAYGEWQAGELTAATRHLADCPERLRGWEWAFAQRLCHLDRLTFRGHRRPVRCVAFSPDGERIASGTGSFIWDVEPGHQEFQVWEAATGRPLFVQTGLRGGLQAIAFSPDGRTLATAEGVSPNAGEPEGAVTLWDVAGRRTLWRKDVRGTNVLCLAFSPDGTRLAAGIGRFNAFGGAGERCQIYNATSGDELGTLPGRPGGVAALAFHPRGRLLALASSEAVEVWDATTRKRVRRFPGFKSYIYAAAFSPDGTRLAAGGAGDVTRIWDVASGATTVQIPAQTVRALAYSPDGARLLTATEGRLVQVWDAATGAEVTAFRGHKDAVTGAAFSPDGERIASSSQDGTVKLWDSRAEQPITLRPEKRPSNLHWATGVALVPDGRRAVTASLDNAVRLWDATTGRLVRTLDGPPPPAVGGFMCAAARRDGGEVAAGHINGAVWRWDPATGRSLPPLEGRAGLVFGVAYSPDGRLIAAAVNSGRVLLWDAGTGRLQSAIRAHRIPANGVAFSPDGAQLLSWDGVRAWEVFPPAGELIGRAAATREVAWSQRFPKTLVRAAAYAPDGRKVAVGLADGTVKLLGADGRALRTLTGHSGEIRSLAFSDDGSRLATCATDGLRLWDPESGRETFAIPGRPPLSLSFGARGRKLITGMMDGTAQILDATPLAPAEREAPDR